MHQHSHQLKVDDVLWTQLGKALCNSAAVAAVVGARETVRTCMHEVPVV